MPFLPSYSMRSLQKRTLPWLVVACALMISAKWCAADEATISMLDGSKLAGEVVAWNGEVISVKTSTGAQDLSLKELMDARWERPSTENADAISLELVDGTRLRYSEFAVADRRATVSAAWSDKEISIEREALHRVHLRPMTPLIEATLAEIESKEIAGDTLVVSQRESESMDYLTGVIGDVTPEQASFDWDGKRVPVKRSKIAAMVFYQPPQPLPKEPAYFLSLTDGSQIAVSEARLEDEFLMVETSLGVELELPLDQIERADFSAGKVQYLSDLKPSEIEWVPAMGLPEAESIRRRGQARPDTSFAGVPLTLSWKDETARGRREIRSYEKGLAIRSRTKLTYLLPPRMRRFSAIAGIDPQHVSSGSVGLTVSADERVLWEGKVDGAEPQEIDVEIGKARRLHVTVDYGDNLDFGDQLHLIEARVTR